MYPAKIRHAFQSALGCIARLYPTASGHAQLFVGYVAWATTLWLHSSCWLTEIPSDLCRICRHEPIWTTLCKRFVCSIGSANISSHVDSSRYITTSQYGGASLSLPNMWLAHMPCTVSSVHNVTFLYCGSSFAEIGRHNLKFRLGCISNASDFSWDRSITRQ